MITCIKEHPFVECLSLIPKHIEELTLTLANIKTIAEQLSSFKINFAEMAETQECQDAINLLQDLFACELVTRSDYSGNKQYFLVDETLAAKAKSVVEQFLKRIETVQDLVVTNVEHPFITTARELFEAVRHADRSGLGVTIDRQQMLELANSFDSYLLELEQQNQQKPKSTFRETDYGSLQRQVLDNLMLLNRSIGSSGIPSILRMDALMKDNQVVLYFFDTMGNFRTEHTVTNAGGQIAVTNLRHIISEYFNNHPEFNMSHMGLNFFLSEVNYVR